MISKTLNALNDEITKFTLEQFPEKYRNGGVVVRHEVRYTQKMIEWVKEIDNPTPWLWKIEVSICLERESGRKFVLIGQIGGFGTSEAMAFRHAKEGIFKTTASAINTNYNSLFLSPWDERS